MADARLRVLIQARDQSAQGMSTVMRRLDGIKGSLRGAGVAFSAFGAAGALALGKVIESAFAQEIGIAQLDAALKTIGLSYGDLSGEIEPVIDTLQKKTNFGDEAQRDALRKLILVTGDYELALEALPRVLDVAAATGMDLESAALLVGRALDGDTAALGRYGIKLDENATPTEVLAELTNRFRNQAEDAANPVVQLKNRLGDLAQAIAGPLLPVVAGLAILMEVLTRKVLALNPTVLTIIGLGAGLTVALAIVLGPLLILISMVPFLVAGFTALAVVMVPGLVILGALVAVILIAIAVWMKWEDIIALTNGDLSKLPGVLALILAIMNPMIANVASLFLNWTLWAKALGLVKDGLLAVWGALKKIGKIPGIGGLIGKIPGIGGLIGKIPGFAAGGIVTQPTLAMVGERGPEAIIPLGRGGGGGGTTVVLNNPTIFGEMDFERLVVRAVRNHSLGGGFHGVLARP